ncbi:MAG: sulfatase [Myxococcales bacterium]|nr:sulfatase [Myxococcales bacterium]
MLLSLIAACALSDHRPSPVAGPGDVLRLAELAPAELSVPDDTRPGHAAPQARISLDRGWNYAGKSRKGMSEYTTPVPFRPRGLFFYRPVPGMRLIDVASGEDVPYHYGGGQGTHTVWELDRDQVTVYVPPDAPAPGPEAFVIDYPEAAAREARLHRSLSQLEPEDFVTTRVVDGIASRSGLLLPAPTTIAWQVKVPEAAELTFASGIVRPEIGHEVSDGAALTVTVTEAGKDRVVYEGTEHPGTFAPHRVDLSAWSGKDVRVTITTSPGASADEDLVFLEAPTIGTRQANPVTVLMVFVDTLRPDHLSLYGYHRDTTASIDHLKSEGAVFANTRSVAPWTLPSTRSVLTGRYPERWGSTETLQHQLAGRGFATGFIAGNVYLSSNFDMDRDWDYHQVDGLWPSATATTDDALEWLDQHDGRDVLLQVHYMSAHLPYLEPASYRDKYAGASVGGLREDFERNEVQRAGAARDPQIQQYIRDRYDNNIRYATDQIERLIERLDDNDILVLFSDHGEEFWEHGSHEHGHSVFDELLKVPLVIRAKGIGAVSPTAPTSLLDVTPTVLDLVGAPIPEGLDGRSLLPLVRGDEGAEQAFRDRDLAFGHPLYGMEHWGVLHGDQKWATMEGRESLYDLSSDPEEKVNLRKDQGPLEGSTVFRAALEEAVGRDVLAGYRLTPTPWKGGIPIPGLWGLCTVPGGFKDAWPGEEPLETSKATVRTTTAEEARQLLASYQVTDHEVADDAGAVEICWHPGWFGSREVYLVPNRPLSEVGGQMKCSGYLGDESGGQRGTMSIPPSRDVDFGDMRIPLNRLLWKQRTLVWQFGIGLLPDDETLPVDGSDPEMASMLAALGYVATEPPPSVVPEQSIGRCPAPTVQLQEMVPTPTRFAPLPPKP